MRNTWPIHGGIHPPEHKTQSLQRALEAAPIPHTLVLPLSQHIGAPAIPCVNVGDYVKKYQCIAKANGPISTAVHASSSGQVISIEERPIAHPSGLNDRCIVIETDGKDEAIDLIPQNDWAQQSAKQLCESIRNAGIAGMGGAGFPSSVKLNVDSSIIDTLIINGTECEPYITADDCLMQAYPEQIIEGIAILQHILRASNILIGIEDNKPKAIAAMQAACQYAKNNEHSIEWYGASLEVVSFPTKYPSGGEKQLIQILTGKEVPSEKLPAELGIVCQNVGTCIAINDAIRHSKPLISRITTVTGYAVEQQGNYQVRLGTPVSELLHYTGADPSQLNRAIMGGPMMGFALHKLDAPVVKTTNCLLVPSAEELPSPPPQQACIRCGMCAEACPASLLPQQLYWYARSRDLDQLENHNIADCIECGACAYVCPSNIPLVQYYRASKSAIKQRNADHKKSEHSKTRFEQRETRLQRLEEEKQAAKRARQKAAAQKKASAKNTATTNNLAQTNNDDGKAAEIQAALARVKSRKHDETKQSANDKKIEKPSAPTTASTHKEIDAIDDPVERAKARRAARPTKKSEPTPSQLEENIRKIEERLRKAEKRRDDAAASGDTNLAALEKAVFVTREKLVSAQQALTKARNDTKDE